MLSLFSYFFYEVVERVLLPWQETEYAASVKVILCVELHPKHLDEKAAWTTTRRRTDGYQTERERWRPLEIC